MQIDLNDPSMKEIVDEFCSESLGLCEEMMTLLDDFEDSPEETSLLEVFGQMVDRIMGAAQTLGLAKIGTICNLCKTIGYKSSQSKDSKLNTIVSGILMDAVDTIEELVKEIETHRERKEVNLDAFISRLTWLSGKFKHIDRASVAAGDTSGDTSANLETDEDFDDLIAQLG